MSEHSDEQPDEFSHTEHDDQPTDARAIITANRALNKDGKLGHTDDDPRVDKSRGGRKIAKVRGGGRNTESFDPKSTFVRPDLRIIVGPNRPVLNKTLKHDDILVVPEFFCEEDNWDIYYKLIEEMRGIQAAGERGSEWISWHEGKAIVSIAL